MTSLVERNEIVVAEEAAQAPHLEAVFRAITGYAIFSTDCAGLFTSFNRGAELLTGYAAAEVVGVQTPLLLHLPAETAARARSRERELDRRISGYEVYTLAATRHGGEEFQCTYLHKEGVPMPVCVALQPIVAPGREVTGFVGLVHRVKPRRTPASRASGEALPLWGETQPEAVVELARDWSILYRCERALEILPNLVLGNDLWATFPEVLGTFVEENLRDTMEQRRVNEYENLYAPLGIWFRVHASPTSAGIKLFFQDVTESRRMRDQLERERALRQKRVEALSHMAGGLAHEISNPLSVIHMVADDLDSLASESSTVASWAIRAACGDILKTANRAMAILRGLKGFTREASNDPMAPASIESILSDCVELQHTRFERHGIALRVDVAEDLPRVFCREVQIGQIVNNLLNNAFDAVSASPATAIGGGWVRLQASREGGILCIDATDSGPGVPDEAKPNLMEPFFTTKEIGGGTGIGLSLSRAIAQDHGGDLVLLDHAGPTCFRLTLPLDRDPEPAPEQGAP